MSHPQLIAGAIVFLIVVAGVFALWYASGSDRT